MRTAAKPLRRREARNAPQGVERARLESQVPECSYCGKPVAEDYYYEINDEVICAECLDEHFRREVEVD